MPRRPNILVLMADQLAPHALPFYGHPLVQTPNLSRLAQQGVVFDSAYCNSPLCSPSRAVFMTGQLPSTTGVYDNAAEFRAEWPTFAHHLRAAGYLTQLAGKMHFCGPDQLHGFEQRLTTDIYPADFGWTPDWDHPEARPSWYHSMHSVTEAGPCVRTNQMDFDDEVSFAAERALFDNARRSDDRPFCLVASWTHPHDPFAIAQPYWDRYRHDEIDLPSVHIPAEARHPHEQRLRHVCAMDELPITDTDIRNARHAYYGAISYIDDQVGRLLTALETTGQSENTIIILLADHGEMLGERGLWYKMSFFEHACRIPLLIHAPARYASGRVAASVSLIDVLPTLIELADGHAEALATAGRSLLPHLEGQLGHDEVFGEYLAEGAIAPIVMIRRGTWKFIHCPADPDQLYQLSTDPDERLNLADDPTFSDVLTTFRSEAAQRWNLAELDTAVRASQHRRELTGAALTQGQQTAWDYQPVRDASRQYIRNHLALEEMEAMARFPAIHSSNPK